MSALNMDTVFEMLNEDRPRVLEQPVEVTRQVYWYFLECMPPIYTRNGFAIIEADCDQGGRTIRSRFTQLGERYFHQWSEISDREAYHYD